jgi:hypothetical protein
MVNPIKLSGRVFIALAGGMLWLAGNLRADEAVVPVRTIAADWPKNTKQST